MAETGRQAALYDGATSGGTLIGHLSITTAKRARHAAVDHKLDQNWVLRAAGEVAVEMRITAEGVLAPGWFATLNTRMDAGTAADHHLLYAAGDSWTGSFVVEQLDETASGGDLRRFRLVLLSDGPTTYAAS